MHFPRPHSRIMTYFSILDDKSTPVIEKKTTVDPITDALPAAPQKVRQLKKPSKSRRNCLNTLQVLKKY
jgi:hypothetical protein